MLIGAKIHKNRPAGLLHAHGASHADGFEQLRQASRRQLPSSCNMARECAFAWADSGGHLRLKVLCCCWVLLSQQNLPAKHSQHAWAGQYMRQYMQACLSVMHSACEGLGQPCQSCAFSVTFPSWAMPSISSGLLLWSTERQSGACKCAGAGGVQSGRGHGPASAGSC